MRIHIVVLCGILSAYSLSTVGALAEQKEPRLPVPDDAAQKESATTIKDVYKADYDKAKTTPQKLELARKLLQEGEQTEGDPVGKFVLLRIARDMAAQAGNVSVTIQAIDGVAAAYEVDPLEMKVEVLTKMSKSASTAQAHKELVGAIEHVTDVALDVDNFRIAQQLAGLAIAVSRNAKDGELLKSVVARSKAIDQGAAAFAETQKALKVLDEKPTDPAANLVVGKFRCFYRRDWDNGLPLLSIGNDSALKALAEKEAARPTKAAEQAALGDGWWAVSDKESESARISIQSRAFYWYERALPGLSGLPKAKVGKRLAEQKGKESPTKAGTRNDKPTPIDLIATFKAADVEGVPTWKIVKDKKTRLDTLFVENFDEDSRWILSESWPQEYDLAVVLSTLQQNRKAFNDTHFEITRGPNRYSFVIRRTADGQSLLSFWPNEEAKSKGLKLGQTPLGITRPLTTDRAALAFSVRKDAITVSVDGKPMISLKDESPAIVVPSERPSFCTFHNNTVFHSITLTPVSP